MHWQITLLCFWSVDLLTFNKYKRQINKSMEEFVDQQHCSETHCDTFGIAIYIIHWCETRCDIHYSVCMIRCIHWSETRCNIHCGVCMIHCIHWSERYCGWCTFLCCQLALCSHSQACPTPRKFSSSSIFLKFISRKTS